MHLPLLGVRLRQRRADSLQVRKEFNIFAFVERAHSAKSVY